eukprot:CAMPEP_0174730664 /NCGR_PEP_ID=MMETSP1094-20130205/56068_1 /TAXON_ID=156173 /ORGANISM="Chrysochromulina brevifilum, Strain UTEX LB 985" /LENGTH=88 /DNA_ID=CAMNT_0015932947 /DNA_START=333 /DNA_END=599 /DNA_ORIENTATION=-
MPTTKDLAKPSATSNDSREPDDHQQADEKIPQRQRYAEYTNGREQRVDARAQAAIALDDGRELEVQDGARVDEERRADQQVREREQHV